MRESLTPTKKTSVMGGSLKNIHICNDALVMLVQNLDTNSGLVNGSMGKITDILWASCTNESFVKAPPNLSEAVLYDTEKYCTNIRFLNVRMPHHDELEQSRGGGRISIVPQIVFFRKSNGVRMSRKQIPLMPAFEVTIHKF